MLITQKLWERNYNLASLSLNTKFVQGIKNGDLPKTKFQEYLAQDYFFLESFARAYGLAVSKSRNKKNIKTLSVLLSGVSEELILHETYAKEWDIDLTTNLIGPATKKYTDFLEEVSLNLSLIEIMSAVTILKALNNKGYLIKNLPKSSGSLMTKLRDGPTNNIECANKKEGQAKLTFVSNQIRA